MRIILRRDNSVKEIAGQHSVEKVLHLLGLNPESVLVVRGGQLLTRDVVLKEDEEIEVWPVTSGG